MSDLSEEQVIKDFHDKYGLLLTELYSDIKEDLFKKGIPILNQEKSSAHLDFINLILYNIDLQTIYKK